mgnify:CR=1 FL=1
MNIAAILAAGSGQRLGSSLPKQFIEINGKPLIAHTLECFQNHSGIDEILVVTAKEHFAKMEEIKRQYHFSKLTRCIEGGSERHLSSRHAVWACVNEEDNLLLHDAARPNIEKKLLDDILLALKEYHAVAIGVPATDTIYQTDERQRIAAVPNRNRLWLAQTPQSFRVGTIKQAFELSAQDPDFVPTDDISLVVKYLPGENVKLLEGNPRNFKITYAEDLKRLKSEQ